MASSQFSSSIAAVSIVVPHLPDEVKLMILEYVFDLPATGRLRAQTFWLLKQRRVDPIIRWPGWARLVQLVLYSNNTVRVEMFFNYKSRYELRYPPPSCATFVQTLEVRINRLGVYWNRIHPLLLQFLRKLEAGDLGFDNLKTLRFIVQMRSDDCQERPYKDVRRHLFDEPRFRFRAEKLEVQAANHICGPQCTDGTVCQYISAIKERISVYK